MSLILAHAREGCSLNAAVKVVASGAETDAAAARFAADAWKLPNSS
jgi:hypothetical protein